MKVLFAKFFGISKKAVLSRFSNKNECMILNVYDAVNLPSSKINLDIVNFLFKHLDQYVEMIRRW
ncbi:MAG: hypothetical protein R2766_12270 [Saprospiraceae bacterium]